MLTSSIRFLIISLLSLFTFGLSAQIDKTQKDKHIKVALRMIGHQILLQSNDSTSRVLPVSLEKGIYTIKFESEFEFEPNELAKIVNRVVSESQLAEHYIVELQACNSGDIVYSYEVGKVEKSDIIPCAMRIQPKACYNLLFTIVPNTSQHLGFYSKKSNSSHMIWIILAPIILAGIVWYILKRRKKKSVHNPNMIQLGEFEFDKLNMILLLKEKRIELTSKEADLLLLLYKDVNTTIEKEVLLSSVWGDEGDYVGRTLDVFISKLRKKLEFDPKVKIVNIRGVGYKLVMDESQNLRN